VDEKVKNYYVLEMPLEIVPGESLTTSILEDEIKFFIPKKG